jgi:hypothetical protein
LEGGDLLRLRFNRLGVFVLHRKDSHNTSRP